MKEDRGKTVVTKASVYYDSVKFLVKGSSSRYCTNPPTYLLCMSELLFFLNLLFT